jgi:hypothetical protein
MEKYRSKKKPYANVELKGGGGGTKKNFGGSATLTAKKGRTKINLGLGGGWIKKRPIEGIDIKEGGLSKGIDLTVPVPYTAADFNVGASESRDKFQVNTPSGILKNKGKPVYNFRAGAKIPVGRGTVGLSGNITPGDASAKRKRVIGGGLELRFPLNKGGKVRKKNKKK